MYRVSDDIAKKRMLYPSVLISAPSVLVLDLLVENRGKGLPLGRYYPIILETDDEITELEHFLNQPRRHAVRPNLFDQRPSLVYSDNVLISRYEPPVRGWPWLSVCRWPDSFIGVGASAGVTMARGCYTMELFAHDDDLDASQAELVASLADRHEIRVRLLSADALSCPGRA